MGILTDTMKIAALLDKYNSKKEFVEITIPYSVSSHLDIQNEIFKNINSENIQYTENKNECQSLKINGILIHFKKHL